MKERLDKNLDRVARQATWDIFTERVKQVLVYQGGKWNKDSSSAPLLVMQPPCEQEVNVVGRAIVGAMLNERADILFFVGEYVQDMVDGKYETESILQAFQRVMGFIRERGPHFKPADWGGMTSEEQTWAWEEDAKKPKAPPPEPSPASGELAATMTGNEAS